MHFAARNWVPIPDFSSIAVPYMLRNTRPQSKYEQLTSALKTFRLLEGFDHFYFGTESRVCDAVLQWLAEPSIEQAFSSDAATP
jgi:hypothetical protein